MNGGKDGQKEGRMNRETEVRTDGRKERKERKGAQRLTTNNQQLIGL